MIDKLLHNKRYRLAVLIVLITLQAGVYYGGLFSLFFLWLLIDFITIFTLFQYKASCSPKETVVEIYLCWLFLGIIRGGIVAEGYWEWKQLITGTLSLSLPLFVYAFMHPMVLREVLWRWMKYALPIFFVFLLVLPRGAYHFYLGPLFFVGCFIPILPKRWKFIIGGLLVIMLFVNLGSRSQVIKSAMVLVVALGIYYRRYISIKVLRMAHWICYLVPVVLLVLGITGTFNIFEDLASNKGNYVEYRVVDGKVVKDDLAADTRTFIYQEVITSALKHHYVIWGRTPARGNDSMAFGKYTAEELKTGKYERHANEVCHLNVFTWLGMIGIILYSLIYLRSSYLAVYRSNNIYMKYLGCFIAFRWAYGWVEDGNTFAILSISLWMIIAMGLSTKFRIMNNRQMVIWIRSIFK